MEDYYEYLDSNGVTTLYKLIKDDTVALIDSYSVTINGITTTLDTHMNDSDIHTPISDIESMVDTKISGLVNSAPETLDTLKELSDALGNDPNFATTVANQIGTKADKDSVYTKQETDTLLEGKANSVHNHVVSDITDFPTIPTKTSELTNDSGYITNVTWEDVIDKPELSQVAISGSYTDLSNTPTIPTKVSQLENDTGFINALTDVVDTKSNQTINGTKTFTSSPWVTNNQATMGFSIKNTAIARNDIPTEYQHHTFRAYDKNSNILGEYCIEKSTTGCTLLNMNVRSEDSNGNQLSESLYLNMSNDGSAVRFYPSSNNKMDLGMSNHKWAKVYSDDVVHTSGNETIDGTKTFTSILKVSQGTLQVGSDAGYSVTYSWTGNIINKQPSGTFNISMPKANGTLAIDENVVHKSGNETINGVKSFNNLMYIYDNMSNKNSRMDLFTTPANTLYSHYMFVDKNNEVSAYMQYGQQNTGTDFIGLFIHDKNRALHGILVTTNNEVIPFGNNIYNFGSPNNKWANVYATTFNGNLKGNADSATYSTTQAISDNSTKIATTAWVRNYVNSVGGSGSSAIGSSVSAYWSNGYDVTSTQQASNERDYPECYSNYINRTPSVGIIYSGAQLYSEFNAYANATRELGGSVQNRRYITKVTAQAIFSNPISSTGKYLCTTANNISFRAYAPEGKSAASVIDYSATKSIFIRVE